MGGLLSSFSSLDLSFFWHENTIQELPLILGSNFADLWDLGAHKGDELYIDTLEDDLILKLWAHFGDAPWEHVNFLDLFTA